MTTVMKSSWLPHQICYLVCLYMGTPVHLKQWLHWLYSHTLLWGLPLLCMTTGGDGVICHRLYSITTTPPDATTMTITVGQYSYNSTDNAIPPIISSISLYTTSRLTAACQVVNTPRDLKPHQWPVLLLLQDAVSLVRSSHGNAVVAPASFGTGYLNAKHSAAQTQSSIWACTVTHQSTSQWLPHF